MNINFSFVPMVRFYVALIIVLFNSLTGTAAFAQCENNVPIATCTQTMHPYNSDGHHYHAELFEDEIYKLKMFFHSGVKYRIVACGQSSTQDRLQFAIYDRNGLQVASNKDNRNAPYYDLTFGAADQYIIECKYPKGGGCVSLMIGYHPADKKE